jgi:hypothetical protein
VASWIACGTCLTPVPVDIVSAVGETTLAGIYLSARKNKEDRMAEPGDPKSMRIPVISSTDSDLPEKVDDILRNCGRLAPDYSKCRRNISIYISTLYTFTSIDGIIQDKLKTNGKILECDYFLSVLYVRNKLILSVRVI